MERINGIRKIRKYGLCLIEAEVGTDNGIRYLSVIVNDRNEQVSSETCSYGVYNLPITFDKAEEVREEMRDVVKEIVDAWNANPEFYEHMWMIGWKPDKNLMTSIIEIHANLINIIGRGGQIPGCFIKKALSGLRATTVKALYLGAITPDEVRKMYASVPCHWEIIDAIKLEQIIAEASARRYLYSIVADLSEMEGICDLSSKLSGVLYKEDALQIIAVCENGDCYEDCVTELLNLCDADEKVSVISAYIEQGDYAKAKAVAEELPSIESDTFC